MWSRDTFFLNVFFYLMIKAISTHGGGLGLISGAGRGYKTGSCHLH